MVLLIAPNNVATDIPSAVNIAGCVVKTVVSDFEPVRRRHLGSSSEHPAFVFKIPKD
jgi:hypothetical protein